MILNLVVIVLLLVLAWILSAYGFFSSLLHFACVVGAGAIAFAAWEPVVMLFAGSRMPDYAWGVTLVVLFGLALGILRLVTGKAVPHNVNFSTTSNFIGGAAMGILSAILTVGMLLIGIQFMQQPHQLLGFDGWVVSNSGEIVKANGAAGHLWVPVDEWTAKFYSMASRGSMYAPHALHELHPDLAQQASLYRKSAREGASRQGMQPDFVKIESLARITDFDDPQQFLGQLDGVTPSMQAPNGQFQVYVVGINVNNGAKDEGDKLRLTKAQVRLVVRRGNEYLAVHPHAFIQTYQPDIADEARFLYDTSDLSANSVGASEVHVKFEFVVPSDATPSHMMVRQMRADIPSTLTAAEWTEDDLDDLAPPEGQTAPEGGRTPKARPWIGYLAMLGCGVVVISVSVREPKRGHQD